MDEETLPKNQGWGVRWPLEAPMLYHISGAPLSPSLFWVHSCEKLFYFVGTKTSHK